MRWLLALTMFIACGQADIALAGKTYGMKRMRHRIDALEKRVDELTKALVEMEAIVKNLSLQVNGEEGFRPDYPPGKLKP